MTEQDRGPTQMPSQAPGTVRTRRADPAAAGVDSCGVLDASVDAAVDAAINDGSEVERLAVLARDLWLREQEAVARELDAHELLALAAERDRIAVKRDGAAATSDEAAAERDMAGLSRDVVGSGRDLRARTIRDDMDPGFADRSLSGMDRDWAAGDRGDSHDDRASSAKGREAAAADRTAAASDRAWADAVRVGTETALAHAEADLAIAAGRAADYRHELEGLKAALESRNLIGQAQGMLMSRYDIKPDAAFAILSRISQHENIKLRDVAARLVAEAGHVSAG